MVWNKQKYVQEHSASSCFLMFLRTDASSGSVALENAMTEKDVILGWHVLSVGARKGTLSVSQTRNGCKIMHIFARASYD